MLGQNMKVYTCSILKIATEKEIISIDKILYIYNFSCLEVKERGN